MPTELTIEVLAAPVVNHAMAHNGLPFLHRLVVSASVPLTDVLITARVVDAFGTVLSRPWQHPVERVDAGQPLVVDQPALRLDPAYLSGVEEETGAEIMVEVTVAGDPVGSTTHPIRVQAARQWTLDPAAPVLSLEMLAAFVQPNHPALPGLISEAAQILATVTGSGALAVSHATPERVDQIVGAVFTAVHDREIFYAQPPASWGYGQKVRTPGDVLTDRVGTCLDATLLLASALEHVGITPVLWIAYGHAFLGYWREPERGLPDAASTQIAVPANAVDLELMGVVETTLVTRERRPPRDLVRRARQAPRDAYFLGGAAELLGVVDVGMARMLRVYPLPARRERADGVVEVVEYVPPTQPTAPSGTSSSAAPAAAAQPSRSAAEPVPPRVQAWKNALLDLTLRNKLLNLRQPMTQVPLLLPPEHLGVLANQLQEGRTVSVRAVDDLTGAVVSEGARDAYALPADVQRAMLTNKATIYSGHARDDHDRAFARLRYRARTGREETGANPLMLALGRLDWQLGERTLAAPLLLLPVDIKGVVMPYRLAADPTGAVIMNLSLVEKLRVEFGFTAPDLDELPVRADGEGVDVEAVVRRFRQAIAESGLSFRVESEARLIIGGFTGFLLWRDLDEHWERFVQRPLVRQLLDGKLAPVPELAETSEHPLDDPAAVARLDAVVATAPIPADGAQAQAIAAARAGHSFVLEGPPGTGKSQTITNILADQLAQGRRVLFVAEKGAALDVVRHRLGEIGLLPYALDLHDHNARPVEVRARIRTALAQRARPDLDGYRAALGEVEGSASALRAYAHRLHRVNRAGMSLWSARATALARGDGPSLTVPPTVLGEDVGPAESSAGVDLDRLRNLVAGAVDDLSALDPEVSRAWGFVGVGVPTVDPAVVFALLPAADAAVVSALSAVGQVTPGAATLLGRASTWSQLNDLVELLGAPVGGHELAELSSPRWAAARVELTQRTDTLRRSAAAVLTDFAPDVLGVDLAPVRQQLRIAGHSFFLGRKGRLLTAAGPVLTHLRPGREVPPKALPARIDSLAALADQHRGVVAGWQSLPGLGWLSPGLNLLTDVGAESLTASLATVDRHLAALGRLGPRVAAETIAVRQREPELATATTRACTDALARLGAVFAATHSRTLDQAAYGAAGLWAAWRDGISARTADSPHGGALRRWIRAVAAVDAFAADLPEARWQLLSDQVPGTEAVAALERGMAEGSLIERWDAGGFRSFDAAGQDRSVGRFLGAADAVRSASTSVLPSVLIKARPFGAGAVFGKVAALEREVGRSRGGLSVRSLITTYGDVIAAITPCVLVSPDSLARFIAPGALDFDLVVFDEASQITVPDAVGALGRATACVVAGDSQQMPPYSFGQLGNDDGEDTDHGDFIVVPDEESILSECVQSGLPRLWLSWHYRSRDESLISFSNAQYYEDRLSSFPAFPGQLYDTGVSFTRVHGTFLRSGTRGTEKGLLRTNLVEAAAVVEEVLRRWQQRERSIGVVTFNIQQRGLIESMLWDSEVEGVREALASKDDGLFVKNLENVQGDERDVIIFSTGFSVDANGVLPLNFGPLNRSGGERRLNVAVTRARRRVMVFCSFEPEDLRIEQTSSVGIKHLRDYLEQAKYGAPPRVRSEVAIDRHAEQIAAALRAAGCVVQTEVGLSEFRIDLAVGAPGLGEQPTLAVLLDGPAWVERATTGDRDGAPVSVLSTIMGWPAVTRVWLPAWLSDPEGVVREVVDRAHASAEVLRQVGEVSASTSWQAYEQPTEEDQPAEEPLAGDPPAEKQAEEPADAELDSAEPQMVDEPEGSSEEITAAELEPVAAVSGLEVYVESDLGPYPSSVLERLDDSPLARRTVVEVMRQIVEESGPISVERLGRRLVKAFGRSRLVDHRLAQLRALLPDDLRRDREEGFCWPATRDPLDWTGFRTSADVKVRPLTDIALLEIANAMAYVGAQAMGIGIDELFKQTHKLFGGNRLTEPVRSRLAHALDVGVARERLRVRGGVVTSAEGSVFLANDYARCPPPGPSG